MEFFKKYKKYKSKYLLQKNGANLAGGSELHDADLEECDEYYEYIKYINKFENISNELENIEISFIKNIKEILIKDGMSADDKTFTIISFITLQLRLMRPFILFMLEYSLNIQKYDIFEYTKEYNLITKNYNDFLNIINNVLLNNILRDLYSEPEQEQHTDYIATREEPELELEPLSELAPILKQKINLTNREISMFINNIWLIINSSDSVKEKEYVTSRNIIISTICNRYNLQN